MTDRHLHKHIDSDHTDLYADFTTAIDRCRLAKTRYDKAQFFTPDETRHHLTQLRTQLLQTPGKKIVVGKAIIRRSDYRRKYQPQLDIHTEILNVPGIIYITTYQLDYGTDTIHFNDKGASRIARQIKKYIDGTTNETIIKS